MLRRLIPAIMLLMLLALAGCEDQYYPTRPGPVDSTNLRSVVLENTAWRLVSFEEGNRIDTVDFSIDVTLIFSGSSVRGVAGCNAFGGFYTAGESLIQIDSITIPARNWCPAVALQGRYLAALDSATSYRVRNGRLRITYERGNALNFVADQRLGNEDEETTKYWSEIAPIGLGRFRHTATALNQGTILVAGGTGPDFTINGSLRMSGCMLYDPVADQWSVASDMKTPRAGHTATLLNNRRVLVVGGGPEAANVTDMNPICEIYDPQSAQWSPAAPLSMNRSNHTATLLANGDVLIIGGDGDFGLPLATCAIYRVATNSWDSLMPPMSVPRSGHTAVLLDDGSVLVAGGEMPGVGAGYSEIYDPLSNRWTLLPGPSSGANASVMLDDGTVLVVATDMEYAEIYEYNPITPSGGWRPVPGIKQGGAQAPNLLKLCSGNILLTGFYDGSCMIYDVRNQMWSEISPMQYPRFFHTPVLTRQCGVIAIGGWSPNGSFVPPCELYNE